MPKRPAKTLRRQVAQLQSRLVEAEDTLDAIRSGSIDALVVRTPRGEQLFTLKGADQTYRTLVEAMSEGAVTLNRSTICFCNQHFARMARTPLEKIMGRSIFDWIASAEFRHVLAGLNKGRCKRASLEASLRSGDGDEVPVLLSASRFESDGKAAIGLVLTDITERKEVERARHELSRRILNAQELERQRVARELHDGVNQLLSSAKYRLNNHGQHQGDPSQENVRLALRLVEKAIAEVKLISRNLRPSELDDLGLPAALRSLAREFETQSGIRTRFEGQSNGEFPAEVELALYRIAQEALTNVANHSKATCAEMSLFNSGSRAVLTVEDNGKGLAPRTVSQQRRGWGLKNMKARASLLGGTFSIEPSRAGGTQLYAAIPVFSLRPKKHERHKQGRAETQVPNGDSLGII